jgi:hypothetical protein
VPVNTKELPALLDKFKDPSNTSDPFREEKPSLDNNNSLANNSLANNSLANNSLLPPNSLNKPALLDLLFPFNLSEDTPLMDLSEVFPNSLEFNLKDMLDSPNTSLKPNTTNNNNNKRMRLSARKSS